MRVCDSTENDKMNTNYINYFRAKGQKAQRKTQHIYLQTVVKVEICQKAAENGETAATKKI